MRSKFFIAAFLAVSSLLSSMAVLSSTAQAKVLARVNLSSQTMNVYVNGSLQHSWAISSGKAGYNTPRGTYGPTRLVKMHYSKKYNNAPMPNSIFFRGGFAIHGTGHTGALGRPASHGCVRLSRGHAHQLYSLVKAHGARNTRISISGYAPQVASYRRRVKTSYRNKRNVRTKTRYKAKRRSVRRVAKRKKWTHTWGVDG